MGGLVSALTTRINPGGQKEIKIKPFGDTAVEILIPKAEPAEIAIIKQKLSSAGTLEFRILASRLHRDHKRLIDLAEKTDTDLIIDPVTNIVLGKWVPVKKEEVNKLPPESVTPRRIGRAAGSKRSSITKIPKFTPS
jgi:SecD/SecF fusion protein